MQAHSQKPLKDDKEMSWCATIHSELVIAPPVFNTTSTPSKLKYSSSKNRDEKKNEPHASIVTRYVEKLVLRGTKRGREDK